MLIITPDEMRRLEALADASGLTYAELMQRAGAAVAEAVATQVEAGDLTVVLCGPGNNGGDGLIAASVLASEGYPVRIALWKRRPDDLPEGVGSELADAPVLQIEDGDSLETLADWLGEAAVAVDALLGIGVNRPIEGLLADVLGTLGAAASHPDGPAVVAVDVPSGLNAEDGAVDDATVAADLTITFGLPKAGQLRFPAAEYIGEMIVEPVGIPTDGAEGNARLATGSEVAASLPPRPMSGHKGTFGRALIVAGSINYTGAAYLAAAAAYRVGCGLVTSALPGSIHAAVAGQLPEATFLILAEDMGVIARGGASVVREAWVDYDAVLLGPGLTTQRSASEFIEALLSGDAPTGHQAHRTIGFGAAPDDDGGGDPHDGDEQEGRGLPARFVVDADGLNLLAKADGGLSWLPPGSVLTPHPGEMARLTGRTTAEVNAAREAVAAEAAAEWGHVVVLKGALTVVAAPDGRISINPFANPALATAGTGDVLSGAIAGLLAQGMNAFDAAVAGAYLHALAGELASDKIGGRGTTAGDVLGRLAEAVKEVEA